MLQGCPLQPSLHIGMFVLDYQQFFVAAAILKIANGVAGSAASLVPASVPRPIAKLGVIGITSLVALWLFGKVSC